MTNFRITPVNEDLKENGSWGTYRGVSLLIARANNTKFKQIFRRLTKPYKRDIDRGTLDQETLEEIWASCMSETILLDWKNHPANIKYSKENAKQLILQDPDAADFIKEFSEDVNNYIEEETKEVVEK